MGYGVASCWRLTRRVIAVLGWLLAVEWSAIRLGLEPLVTVSQARR